MPINASSVIFNNLTARIGILEVNRIVNVINAGSSTLANGLSAFENAVVLKGWTPLGLGSGGTGRLDFTNKVFTVPSGMLPSTGIALTDVQIGQFIEGLAHEAGHFTKASVTVGRYASAGTSKSAQVAACFGAEGDAFVFVDDVRREFRANLLTGPNTQVLANINIANLGLSKAGSDTLSVELDAYRRELNRSALTAAEKESALGLYAGVLLAPSLRVGGANGAPLEVYRAYCSRVTSGTTPAPEPIDPSQSLPLSFGDDFVGLNFVTKFPPTAGAFDTNTFTLSLGNGAPVGLLETVTTSGTTVLSKANTVIWDYGSESTSLFTDNAGPFSTFIDTPDGAGGAARVIDTTAADGQTVRITQRGEPTGAVGSPLDYETTAIEINGQPAENTNIIAKVIDDTYTSAKDIILNRGTGEFTHIVEAGDATNPDGTTPSLVEQTGRPDWWNDPRIGTLGSDALSLLSAVRGGSPLPIFTATLNFASHQLTDPAVGEIAAALSAVGSLKGLIDGLERGDLGRILIDGGGIARSAVTIHSGGGKHTRNIEAAVMIGQAVQLKSSGNARKSNTIAKYLYRTWENTVFGRKIGNHVAFEAANDRMWAAAA
jgi:hypothetical protein